MRKISLMCGVFDPPTSSHCDLVKSALSRLKPDKLYISVAKKRDTDDPLLSSAERSELAKAAFEPLGSAVKILDVPVLQNPVAAADVVDALFGIHDNARFSFVLGADRFVRLPEYDRHSGITKLMALAVAPRPHLVSNQELSAAVDKVPKSKIAWLPMSVNTVDNSTAAKEALMEGDLEKLSQYVPASTLDLLRSSSAFASKRANQQA